MTGIGAARLHEYYMRMALSIARRGTGLVSPNPRVGCVIVDYGLPETHVASCGFHGRYGGPHAETEAIRNALGPVRGMTAYVTLEPCCHTGHTPPCCDALISAGIARVVTGMTDPDPRVSGGGMARLKAAGVEVVSGVLREECERLNRGFIKRVTEGRPWVTIKAAASMDGNIALENGESKWITGPEARRKAHLMRAENDAVLVGIGTVTKDDPELSVRDSEGRSPIKAVVDKDLEIPLDAGVLRGGERVVFTSSDSRCARYARGEKISALSKMGVRVIESRTRGGHIPPAEILGELAAMGANYVLIEGGAGLISSFIASGLADEAAFFTAPKLMGDGVRVTKFHIPSMDSAVKVKNLRLKAVGADFLLEGEF
jgi:diaminohydroxyphosphoribosylaminopyrimidine deaminase/5-amino-6-(5-phosphoribosylamino)uracil reductase